jgi:hypothetical protein
MAIAYQPGGNPVQDGVTVITAVPQSAPSGLITTMTRRVNSVANINTNKVGVSLDQRFLTWDGPVPTLPAASGDYATATGAAAVITLPAAGVNRNHVLMGLSFGYGATPAAGSNIKIEDGSGNVVYKAPVADAGEKTVNFYPPKVFSSNTALIITLSSGGAGVVGDVNILGRRVE